MNSQVLASTSNLHSMGMGANRLKYLMGIAPPVTVQYRVVPESPYLVTSAQSPGCGFQENTLEELTRAKRTRLLIRNASSAPLKIRIFVAVFIITSIDKKDGWGPFQ